MKQRSGVGMTAVGIGWFLAAAIAPSGTEGAGE